MSNNETASEWAHKQLEKGRRYMREGKYSEAIVYYTAFLACHPLSEVYVMRGDAYAMIDDYERAIEDYERAIEGDPLYTSVYIRLGMANIMLGRYTKAIFSDCENMRREWPFFAKTIERLAVEKIEGKTAHIESVIRENKEMREMLNELAVEIRFIQSTIDDEPLQMILEKIDRINQEDKGETQ